MDCIRSYGAIFKMGLADALQYRFNFFTQVLLWYFPLIVQILLWNVVFNSQDSGMIAGYTLSNMVTYYIVVMIINELVKTEGIEWTVISDIRDGDLRRYLVQPINFLLFKLVFVFSKKIVVLICVMVNLIPIYVFFNKSITIAFNLSNFTYFFIVLIFSITIFYLIHVSIAMFSFWFTEFKAIFHFLPFVFSILCGTAFPLDILPDWLNKLLSFTPFYYVVYFPTQIILGDPSSTTIYKGLMVQVLWLGIFFILSKFVWRKGIQQYSAVGG